MTQAASLQFGVIRSVQLVQVLVLVLQPLGPFTSWLLRSSLLIIQQPASHHVDTDGGESGRQRWTEIFCAVIHAGLTGT